MKIFDCVDIPKISRHRIMMSGFIVMLFTVLFPMIASGQWHNFLRLNTDDGLSHNNVKAIAKDNLGFIWIGTKNGLDRFDGKLLRNYNCVDSVGGHKDNNVGALYDDGKCLWIGTDTGVFSYYKRTERFHFLDLKTAGGESINNWVGEISGDSFGNVWIIVPNQGIFKVKDNTLIKMPLLKEDSSNMSPSCIVVGHDNTIWVGTWRKGLFFKNPKEDRFRMMDKEKSDFDFTELEINSMSLLGKRLFIATQDGKLFALDTETKRCEPIEFGNSKGNIIRTLSNDGKNIFVGTYEGLYVLDKSAKQIGHLRHNSLDASSLCDDIIFSIFNDKEGNLWIGTLFGGISYYPASGMDFRKYFASGNNYGNLSSDRIRGLDMDSSGCLWIGTEGGGINRVNQDGTLSRFGKQNSTIFRIVHFGDSVYCGTYSDGLYVFDMTGNERHYSPVELNIEDSNVFAIYRDDKGNFWLGNGNGAWKSRPGKMIFQKVEELAGVWVHDIKQDDSGNIWFASNGGGIRRMDTTGKLHKYIAGNDTGSLKSNNVTSIFIDSKKRLWFSTDHGGIALYNYKNDDFTTFSKEQGLPDDVAYDILEDSYGNLWFGTNNGIVSFNPDKGTVRTYDKSHGLRGTLFNYSSACKGLDGSLYFGGEAGVVSFNPSQGVSSVTPALYFSKLSVDGKEVLPGRKDSILKESILFTPNLTIPAERSNISLDLSMPVYWGGKSSSFYYRLDPLDKEWRMVNGNTLNFAGLAPGKYTLMVRGETSDGTQAYAELELKITPPWYASAWAIMAYILVSLIVLGVIIFLYKKRKERQFRHLQRMIDMENEKEIYEAKLGFFTEVAHEIRTPVTLISAPLESIKEMNLPDSDLTYNLRIIESNATRLLALISQILDLEKVGREKYVLDCKCRDITEIVKETTSRFESSFVRAGQKFKVSLPECALFANVDKDALIKILSNMLNNALKYGEHETSLTLECKEEIIVVRVSNDGDLIPYEMREKIFQPFVRGESTRFIKPGSGIGLGLAKALASLQGGDLYIDNEDEAANTFVLELTKCDVKEEGTSEVPAMMRQAVDDASGGKDLSMSSRVLIVEDNDEIREFLGNRLQAYFKTVAAKNGMEALEKLRKGNIDLVVTDLMMPEMNGVELCTAIKDDEVLSHIPVIILTAKNDTDSKLTSFRCGAEAFIGKPFSFTVLKEQIVTLLRNRQKEREAFSRSPYLSITPSEDGSEADKEFNARFMKIIEENMADEDFNVEKLADILCLSRSALFRKLKQQFGLAPVVLLRTVRLKKGAELIATGKYRIAEIGPMVGISSPSYFNNQFQKQFGMTPKEYEHQCRIRQESSDKDGLT